MDYEAKAKELREKIFDHAEQGHGGPCLRSGPLDKLLEDWLRSTFPPAAPSYDYGFRVAMHPPQAPSYGYQISADPKACEMISVLDKLNEIGALPPAHQVTPREMREALDRCATFPVVAGQDFTDWKPDPTTGSMTIVDDVSDKVLTPEEWKEAARLLSLCGMTPLQLRHLRDQCIVSPARFDAMQTRWPTPRPRDPAPGDTYIGRDGDRFEWLGHPHGWMQLTDRPESKLTASETIARMRKQRGF